MFPQVLTLDQLKDKLSEMASHEPHLGLDPTAASTEDPSLSLETERFLLGQKVRRKFSDFDYTSLLTRHIAICEHKVIAANHAPLSQEFLKRGCPHSLRGRIWAQVTIPN